MAGRALVLAAGLTLLPGWVQSFLSLFGVAVVVLVVLTVRDVTRRR